MSEFTDILNLSGSALSISFENKYLGANYGSYAKTKTISFRGFLLPTGQYSGVKDTFSTYEDILNSAHDSCSSNTEFVINGRNFGSGRVLSVSFEDRENPITVGSYNMELQIYDSGGFDSTQITSAFDSDVKDELEASKPHLIESINESFSFDQGEGGGFSFSHEFSINFISGESGYDYVTAAKSIADHIIGDLSNEPDYGFVGEAAGYYNSANYTTAKHLYNENYNLVDLNFSFSKNYSTVGLQDSYIDQKQALTITRDDAGFYTVVENGDIRANENGGYSHLISALNEVVSGSRFAHRRCTAYFNSVNSTNTLLGGGELNDDLYSGHTQFGWNLDEEAEKINYNISFTNNPRFTSSGIHEYTQSLTEDKQAGTITVSENGSLRPYNDSVQFITSGNFAAIKNIVNTTSLTRAKDLAQDHYRNWKFTTHIPNHSVLTFDNDLSLGDNLAFTKQNITCPAFGKQIDYSVELVIDGRKYSSGNLKDITVEVSDTEPTLIRSPQYVINFGEIIQNNNFAVGGTQNSSLGVRSVKVTAQKTRTKNYLTQDPDIDAAVLEMLEVAYKQMLRMPTEINNVKLRESFVQNLNYTFNSDGKIDLTFEIGFVAEAWDTADNLGYVRLKSSNNTTDNE